MKRLIILGLALTLGLGTVGNALTETKVRNNKSGKHSKRGISIIKHQ